MKTMWIVWIGALELGLLGGPEGTCVGQTVDRPRKLPRLGETIDSTARDYFVLFTSFSDFHSATMHRAGETQVEIRIKFTTGRPDSSFRITSGEFEYLADYIADAESYFNKTSRLISVPGVLDRERASRFGRSNIGRPTLAVIRTKEGRSVRGILLYSDTLCVYFIPNEHKFLAENAAQRVVSLAWDKIEKLAISGVGRPLLGATIGLAAGIGLGIIAGTSTASSGGGPWGPSAGAIESGILTFVGCAVFGTAMGAVMGASGGHQPVTLDSDRQANVERLREYVLFRRVPPPEVTRAKPFDEGRR